jgi:hypothetical protein
MIPRIFVKSATVGMMVTMAVVLVSIMFHVNGIFIKFHSSKVNLDTILEHMIKECMLFDY